MASPEQQVVQSFLRMVVLYRVLAQAPISPSVRINIAEISVLLVRRDGVTVYDW
jgi:hypothetical protein